MKATDLRIGNLLRDKISKTELEVIELTKEHITTYVIDRRKYPLQPGWGLEPIELTEEWLLKMGFEKIGGTIYLELLSSIEIGFIGNRFYIQQKTSTTNTTLKIKFVHQLQNLYHALTGQELTIK